MVSARLSSFGHKKYEFKQKAETRKNASTSLCTIKHCLIYSKISSTDVAIKSWSAHKNNLMY